MKRNINDTMIDATNRGLAMRHQRSMQGDRLEQQQGQFEASQGLAERRMGLAEEDSARSSELHGARLDNENLRKEMMTLAKEQNEIRSQWAQSGFSVEGASQLMSRGLPEGEQFIFQKNEDGSYVGQITGKKPFQYAANDDEFTAKVMAATGDPSYMKAVIEHRLNQKPERPTQIDPSKVFAGEGGTPTVATMTSEGVKTEGLAGLSVPQKPSDPKDTAAAAGKP